MLWKYQHAPPRHSLIQINRSAWFDLECLKPNRTQGIGLAETHQAKLHRGKDRVMSRQTSSAHFFLSWARERIDEMDATLASLESRSAQMQAETQARADQFIAEMKNKRDEFESAVRTQADAGETAADGAKARLETEWKAFQAETKKYLETFGKGIEQEHAVFQSQVAAQLNAWRETADKLNAAAKEFAVERRREIDATVSRMKADAVTAEKKLQDLARAGTESWSALNAALADTRATFDRANQAAREAFKRATGTSSAQ